jgi:hypothetical protein
VCLELQIGYDWKVIRADLVADGVVGNRDRSADEDVIDLEAEREPA